MVEKLRSNVGLCKCLRISVYPVFYRDFTLLRWECKECKDENSEITGCLMMIQAVLLVLGIKKSDELRKGLLN